MINVKIKQELPALLILILLILPIVNAIEPYSINPKTPSFFCSYYNNTANNYHPYPEKIEVHLKYFIIIWGGTND